MQYYAYYNMAIPDYARKIEKRPWTVGTDGQLPDGIRDPTTGIGLGLAQRTLGSQGFYSQAQLIDAGNTIRLNYGRDDALPAVIQFVRLSTGSFFEYHPNCSVRQSVQGRRVTEPAGIILAKSLQSKRGASLPLRVIDNFLTIPSQAQYAPLQAMLYHLATDS